MREATISDNIRLAWTLDGITVYVFGPAGMMLTLTPHELRAAHTASEHEHRGVIFETATVRVEGIDWRRWFWQVWVPTEYRVRIISLWDKIDFTQSELAKIVEVLGAG